MLDPDTQFIPLFLLEQYAHYCVNYGYVDQDSIIFPSSAPVSFWDRIDARFKELKPIFDQVFKETSIFKNSG